MDNQEIALSSIPEAVKCESIENSMQENGNNNQPHKVRMVTTTTSTDNSGSGGGSVVSVPVSLPVGSLIAAHFKQMLCVDNNGFISGSAVMNDVTGDVKTIVIQQSQNDGSGSNNSQDAVASESQSSNVNWSSSFDNIEVFPVRCKSTNAELYRSRLGSGGRGRCIRYKDEFFTPSEFEHLCGRGSSKDWKRSIRYGGRSLQALIDDGLLTPHATNCSCTSCCDDDSASGPVRLFTPYKRRKKNQPNDPNNPNQSLEAEAIPVATPAKKAKRNSPSESQPPKPDEIFIQEANVVTRSREDDMWPTLQESLEEPTEFLEQSQIVMDNSHTFKQLETAYTTMVRATNDFKRLFLEVRDVYNRKIEQLQNERDAALIAARVHSSDMDDPISNAMTGNELVSPKKCANCNREALAECSLCRRTPYCSTFCQRKDWNAHQVECTRESAEHAQQIMLLVDDQS